LFKKLFTMVLLAAAFCGGYHLGHQPGSLDLAPYAKGCHTKVVAAYHQAEAMVRAGAEQIKSAQTLESPVRRGEKILPGVRADGSLFSQAPVSHKKG
jgi:hypothetical protein